MPGVKTRPLPIRPFLLKMARTMLMLLIATSASLPPEAVLLKQASTQLVQIIASDPSDARPHLLLGRVYSRAGAPAEAMGEFRIAAADGSLAGLLAEAHQQSRLADWSAVLDEATRAQSLAQQSGKAAQELDALLLEAYARLGLGRYEQALADCQRIESSPPAPLSRNDRARLLATKAGALGLKAQEGGIGALLTIGPRVKGVFEQAIAADPRHALAWYGLGRYYLEAPLFLNNRGEALRCLIRADQLDPGDINIRSWYLYALGANGHQNQEHAGLSAFQSDFADAPIARSLLAKLEAGHAPK